MLCGRCALQKCVSKESRKYTYLVYSPRYISCKSGCCFSTQALLQPKPARKRCLHVSPRKWLEQLDGTGGSALHQFGLKTPRSRSGSTCKTLSLQPPTNGLQPTSNGLKPTSGLQPTSNGLQPTSDGLQPTSNGLKPTSSGLQPTSDGQQPTSDGLQPTSNGLKPTSNGLQPTSDGLQPSSDGLQPNIAKASNLI